MNPILHKVMEIVADNFGEKIGDLTPETHFAPTLSASLHFVEAIITCEEEFGITIPDEDATNFDTIGMVAAYIENRLEIDHVIWPSCA
jgi:acyl carrier protein